MKSYAALIIAFVSLPAAWSAGMIPGNADRGAAVFKEKRCGSCHALNGRGPNVAPDLAKEPGGRFTPVQLAVNVWNHGPKMWSRMKIVGAEKQEISYQNAADLFAYLYTFRYFEEPGDAAQGKRVFDAKGCIACHAQGTAGASPVMKWKGLNDPIGLARSMWNHAPLMAKALGKNATWPTLTAQDMTNLLAYARTTPGAAKAPAKLAMASAETGEVLFRVKGCAGCHTGAQALAGKTGARTFTELAAEMWNHVPEMRDSAFEIRPEEMNRLVGYLWSIQYFDGAGDPARGLQVAVAKNCIECHGDPQGATPRFSSYSGRMDSIRFLAGSWNHAAGMQEAMRKAGDDWPTLSKTELKDLLAYVNSL